MFGVPFRPIGDFHGIHTAQRLDQHVRGRDMPPHLLGSTESRDLLLQLLVRIRLVMFEERALDGGSKCRVPRTKLAGQTEDCLARRGPRSGQDQRHTTAGSKDDPAPPVAALTDQGADHRVRVLGSLQKVQNANPS